MFRVQEFQRLIKSTIDPTYMTVLMKNVRVNTMEERTLYNSIVRVGSN